MSDDEYPGEQCPFCKTDVPSGARVCTGCQAYRKTRVNITGYTLSLILYPFSIFILLFLKGNYPELFMTEELFKKEMPMGPFFALWACGFVVLFIISRFKRKRDTRKREIVWLRYRRPGY